MSQTAPIQIVHPPRERWGSALNLALSLRPFAERMTLAEGLIRQAPSDRKTVAFDGLFEARRGEQTLGAAMVVVQPGRTALVYQPQLVAEAPAEAAKRLWAAIDDHLRRHEVCLAQEVLPLEATASAANSAAHGFGISVELIYLAAGQETFPHAPPTGALEFRSLESTGEEALCDVLTRTYVGTLDCPEINGVRSSLDTLEGYRASGKFNPRLWGVLYNCAQPVGSVLITPHDGSSAELVYMGLIPEARGRGLATTLVDWAKRLARQASCTTLSVAVDARNAPALKVYDRAGFQEFDRRLVLLRVIR